MSTSLLGSGNDGTAQRAIVEFVTSAAVEGSSGFAPPAERIAVFDNDGTLWVEKPAPVQSTFVLGKLAARVQADPSLARKQPYRAIVAEDESFSRALDVQDPDAVTSMVEAIGSAWEGTIFGGVRGRGGSVPGVLASRALRSAVLRPRPPADAGAVRLPEGVRLAAVRLLGGGRDFMRVICEETRGGPRENVIGSAPEFPAGTVCWFTRRSCTAPSRSGPESRSTSAPVPAGGRASRPTTTTWTSRCSGVRAVRSARRA